MQVKANLIEQTNIELSIQIYQKHLNEKKDRYSKLVNDLQTSRVEKLQFIHDKKIQLVVKRGLVEVPLTGFMNDFDNAVMVNRKEVEYVNGLIMVKRLILKFFFVHTIILLYRKLVKEKSR